MDSSVLPGFRFNPSEGELLFNCLKRKNCGIKETLDVIPEMDVDKCEPWELPDRSFLPKCNKQWSFFSPCDWKYRGGSVDNIATEAGYWKITGSCHTVHSQSILTGVRNTLCFYKGRLPHGEKTESIMHEYHIDENEFKTGAALQSAFVLCHVLRRYELPAKSGGLQNTEIEKFDSSPKSRIRSCGEDKSEDGSKLDSMPNGLGSNSEFGWLPPSNNDFPQVPDDISFTRPEATYGYLTGEEMDEYIEQTEIIEEILQACLDSQNSIVDHSFPEDRDADILNGDYIELNDFENCESSL
ncbi:NAC domain-containing protein 71 isoform X1 [Cryptomeria japonica]|uniref:NAC domain-containing protein 71 isoform X1 n=1 Tax=Cryptomeria japonica TaxID=3369 RepID=UPI0027DA1EFA|nr:NAC domain-containing protein 71 isoform X1 [Cryptomeria japonica]